MVVPCMWIDRTTGLVLQCHLQLVGTTNCDRLTGPNLTVIGDCDIDRIPRKHSDRDAVKVVAVLDEQIVLGTLFCYSVFGNDDRILDSRYRYSNR